MALPIRWVSNPVTITTYNQLWIDPRILQRCGSGFLERQTTLNLFLFAKTSHVVDGKRQTHFEDESSTLQSLLPVSEE